MFTTDSGTAWATPGQINIEHQLSSTVCVSVALM